MFFFYLTTFIGHCQIKKKCDRKTVDLSVLKKLPKGICVSEIYTIDKIITGFDFDHDKREDVAVRYSIYPIKNGQSRYYSIFRRITDTVFVRVKELNNISPPFVSNIYETALGPDSILVRLYPLDAMIEIKDETIKVSHIIPEFYGKTYEYQYNEIDKNWFLKKIQYWIGNLDEREIERMDLSKKLADKNVLEEEVIKKKISIDQLNLSESKHKASSEEKRYLMNKYDLFDWSIKNN